MFSSSGRQVGVGIPDGQNNPVIADAPPFTVLNLVRAETWAVEYTDEMSRRHITMAHYIGGAWYIAPNGENYSASLRPVSNNLRPKLDAVRAQATTKAPPPKDAIDILPAKGT